MSGLRVAVAGGGLGGLCLAQGLLKAGVDVTVYERDAQLAARRQGYRLHVDARAGLAAAGLLPGDASAEDLRRMLIRMSNDFRDKAPLSAAQAATVILDGVRSGAWRILVGRDARTLDERIRAKPEAAYDYAELFRGMTP